MAKESTVVQQAIFTSAKTDRSAGYQILAASPGLVDIDRRELVAWGPSHNSLLDPGSDATSINFFPLPSGAFCISHTTTAGAEFSGRGHRIYTHCLIASCDTLRQFENHPLRLIEAALATGGMQPLDTIPARLPELELPETVNVNAAVLLARLSADLGPLSLAMLVQGALTNVCLAVRGAVETTRLIGGLFDCLPVDCRTSISFSTGLKFSTRRPFDVLAMPDDAARQRWLSHRSGLATLDLSLTPASANLLGNAWAKLVNRALSAGNFAFLAQEVAKPRADFTLADLQTLGLQLLDEFEAIATEQPRVAKARQAHAAHCKFQKSLAKMAKSDVAVISAPSESLDADSPQIVARLEALDDAVFDAVQGKAAALTDLHKLWPVLKIELGEALLAESREQYIRYALSLWQEPASIDGDQDPARAVNALEVLCVLFDEAR